VQCAESLRVQAYFDGQVDALGAADIERHLEHCAECRELMQDLEQVRSLLRRDPAYACTPPALRSQILRALDEESATERSADPGSSQAAAQGASQGNSAREMSRPRQRASSNWRGRSFWMGALGGAGGAAIAATLAFLLLVPPFATPLLDDLVSAHVRSLMPAHLIDVVSTDKHTVKPWFAGHADVSPAVADFEQQGYKLIGGRADYLDHQRSAVVVYQHGAHVINVFSWAANDRKMPDDATRSGYHLAFWKAGDLEYCAVSDTGWEELLGLVRLLRDLGAREAAAGRPNPS
jgi:anti-sigma factor RsiW